jgi:hypothetical protein
MVLHASNTGLVKLKDDMSKFLQGFIAELKAVKAKQEQAGNCK